MTFFDVTLTSSVLTKFKVRWRLWRFPAEENIAHNIPYLVTPCLTTPEAKYMPWSHQKFFKFCLKSKKKMNLTQMSYKSIHPSKILSCATEFNNDQPG